jgi:hypothetical protein
MVGSPAAQVDWKLSATRARGTPLMERNPAQRWLEQLERHRDYRFADRNYEVEEAAYREAVEALARLPSAGRARRASARRARGPAADHVPLSVTARPPSLSAATCAAAARVRRRRRSRSRRCRAVAQLRRRSRARSPMVWFLEPAAACATGRKRQRPHRSPRSSPRTWAGNTPP